MSDRIAMIAVAQTPYEAPNDTWRSHELTYHAVEKVLNDTGLCHFLDVDDPSRLKIGLRVRAVFKKKRIERLVYPILIISG